jgi:hypothetical protein
MLKSILSLMLLTLLSGCLSIHEEVGETFRPLIWADGYDDAYEYVGVYENLDLFRIKPERNTIIKHAGLLVTRAVNDWREQRQIVQILNAAAIDDLIVEAQEIAKVRAAEKQQVLIKQQEIAQAMAAEKQQARIKQQREKERQRLRIAEEKSKADEEHRLRIAKEKSKAAEKRRQYLINKRPVVCEEMITAVNANEVRARRDFPTNAEYRVVGIASDINVTFNTAQVLMEEKTDFFNTCSAEMKTFDEAVDINKGEKFDFLCSSWREGFGNVIFENCLLFSNAISIN